MGPLKQWLESLFFSEPVYFGFFHLLWILALLVGAMPILKVIFRPKKSHYSRYRLLGRDAMWLVTMMICALAIVALAGPQNKKLKLISGGNIDIIFAVDSSFSTRADDLDGKTRLEVIKSIILWMLDHGALRSGDRVTLFNFGTHSIWRLPLSEDVNDFKTKLAEISHPAVYKEDLQLSTDLANVVEHISRGMDKQDSFFRRNAKQLDVSWVVHNRVAFLFSDGDDSEGADLTVGIRELNKRHIKVFPVGVGTRSGKQITVQVYNSDGFGRPVKVTIKTALQMQRLNEIAAKTGGTSYVVDSTIKIPDARAFLLTAINDNRDTLPRLVPSNEGRELWWEVLAIPGLLLLGLMIKWS